ncbi:MAG: efflux RND transporter periplasmic adaptor subunit, partial [Hyphomicrobium sp.]|nr:efflux RND transporter periplasmic adaptor subunit [Hyphomicrobium sp.]
QLWPGQFVNVRILIDTLERVVVVPTPAVQRGPNGTFVYVVEADEKVALKPVALTMQNESEAVIATGVAAGDRIVTTGFARLKDGARVDVSAPETPGSPAPVSAKPETKTDPRNVVATACAADVQKLCPGVERQGIRGCLRANAGQLSDT